MKQPKLIRKYVNRRLYDTTQSRYVNLDELRELIVAGDDIQVVEQSSKQDITTTILLQILEDSPQAASKLLKPDFLAGVIRQAHGTSDPGLPSRLVSALGSTDRPPTGTGKLASGFR
jgi:polyhydroxyalkanoate synthesis repressor PhaR